MTFRILGALAAETLDGVAVPLGSPKQRAVLAILLLHVGEIVPIERLVDLLWGDAAPRTAEHSIQIYISELRRALAPVAGASAIRTEAPGYRLEVAPDEVDAVRFERLVAEGVRALTDGRRTEGLAVLQEALRLWRGPALSDFAYEEFAQPHIRRLHDVHLDAIEELASAELAGGQAGRTIALAEAAIQEDPLRERSRELLMLALYRSGRQVEALRTYERLRSLLDEELGVVPSPAIQRLQERMILHDPTLGVPLSARTGEQGAIDAGSRNPYKGLRAFTEDDRDDFFGRGAMVDRLVVALASGTRLVALVGPSGAGKSSVVAAGLLPRLRDTWDIASIEPSADGLAELERLEPGRPEPGRPVPMVGRPRLIVIDQFEELFTAEREATQQRYLDELVRLVTAADGTFVLVTLRADLYDRPLLFPAFARVFLDGVQTILPMTAEELEAAVVRPAERAGVVIEPSLLGSLIADTVAQPGALPLLQYTLTELFEQRSGSHLTLADYHRMGGLRGILARRAEELYASLDADQQRITTQVFLRLVRPGRGNADTRRRIRLEELTALGLDPVALSVVLETYGRHRLLSFDREEGSGASTVEVAHEALLWEWDRLAGWIDRHRTALRRHEALGTALAEWEESGRGAGYLLGGARLDEFAGLGRSGSLLLTEAEREFLERSLVERDRLAADETARARTVRRLEQRNRVWLLALLGAVVLLVAGGAWAVTAVHAPTTAGLLTHRAGTTLDQMIVDTFDRAASDLGLVVVERDADIETSQAALEALSNERPDVIVVGTLNTDAGVTAVHHPNVDYVAVDEGGSPAGNVEYLQFAHEQGSFLAGAAAALHSTTGRIGFVGGVDIPSIWRFEAGYRAGAAAIDPGIQVLSAYLTAPPNLEGFVHPELGEAAARDLYGQGVDVIFGAAGQSGDGILEAASSLSATAGHQLWVIGVDSDEYDTVSGVHADAWRAHLLTSMVKRLDLVVYGALADYVHGRFQPGLVSADLASGAMELATSGDHINGDLARINALRDDIVDHRITVPCVPPDRLAQAAALGIPPGACQDSGS